MSKNLIEIAGTEIEIDDAKTYAVVSVRPVAIKTDRGTFVKYGRAVTCTDSIERAVRQARTSRTEAANGAPGVLTLVVNIATGLVIADA